MRIVKIFIILMERKCENSGRFQEFMLEIEQMLTQMFHRCLNDVIDVSTLLILKSAAVFTVFQRQDDENFHNSHKTDPCSKCLPFYLPYQIKIISTQKKSPSLP